MYGLVKTHKVSNPVGEATSGCGTYLFLLKNVYIQKFQKLKVG